MGAISSGCGCIQYGVFHFFNASFSITCGHIPTETVWSSPRII
jgi:hypothetical protein